MLEEKLDANDIITQNNIKQMNLWADFLKLQCKITNLFYPNQDKRFLSRPNITVGESIQLFDRLCPARRADETYQDYIQRKQKSQINTLANNDMMIHLKLIQIHKIQRQVCLKKIVKINLQKAQYITYLANFMI